MTNQNPKKSDFEDGQDGEEKKEYASPTRRVLAWVGLCYMIILVLLNFYALSTGGVIRGIGALMLCPAVAGLGVVTAHHYRTGQGRGGLPATLFILVLCVVAFVGGLALGIPALIGQLGGAA